MTRRALIAAILSASAHDAPAWLGLDLGNGAERNHYPCDEPICFGSLLKPFLVIAFASSRASFPRVRCMGASSRCWYARGHGEQDIIAALANSCNTYFLQLARMLDRAAVDQTALSFGLAPPDRSLTPAELIGLGSGWPQTPRQVVHAFAKLTQRSDEHGVQIALQGMKRCAQIGTARATGFACYAKTGTAPCHHLLRAPGDGFAVAIYPPDQPRWVLLVESHSTTGASAARNLKPLAATLV